MRHSTRIKRTDQNSLGEKEASTQPNPNCKSKSTGLYENQAYLGRWVADIDDAEPQVQSTIRIGFLGGEIILVL